MSKVKNIINEEFDCRLSMMVMTYLLDQIGMSNAKDISDEEIDALQENGLMTEDFVKSLVRCARRIARECSFVNDIIPFMVTEFDYLCNKEGENEYV